MTGSLVGLGFLANFYFLLYCVAGNDWKKMSEKQGIVVAVATFIGLTSLIAGSILLNTETTWVRIIGAFMALQPLVASMCALVVISRNEIKETLND